MTQGSQRPLDATPSAIADAFAPLAERIQPVIDGFAASGHSLFLVGGVVRDRLLGDQAATPDVDCTTAARPDVIRAVLEPLAEALWTQGERFGTIGARYGGLDLEITTFRAESYDPASRKPVVSFGNRLDDDLSRRDFTINAMAVSLADMALHDPFAGADDLRSRRLATPLDPEVSFADDPLRMLRAARFLARFDLAVAPQVTEAAAALADRLAIVSAERIHDELGRLLGLPDPIPGLRFLAETGLLSSALAVEVTPEEATAMIDGVARSASPRGRRLALLWPLGETRGQSVLGTLRFSNQDRAETLRGLRVLRALDSGPSDEPALRRLAAIAGDRTLLDEALSVAPGAGSDRMADVCDRFRVLAERERLFDIEPPIDGARIMTLTGLRPGPEIGRLLARLTEYRLDHGPVDEAEAAALVSAWIADSTT